MRTLEVALTVGIIVEYPGMTGTSPSDNSVSVQIQMSGTMLCILDVNSKSLAPCSPLTFHVKMLLDEGVLLCSGVFPLFFVPLLLLPP